MFNLDQSTYLFLIEFKVYVKAILVESPEEIHEPWYKKWKEGYDEKFYFGNPIKSSSIKVVCKMEDML